MHKRLINYRSRADRRMARLIVEVAQGQKYLFVVVGKGGWRLGGVRRVCTNGLVVVVLREPVRETCLMPVDLLFTRAAGWFKEECPP